MARAARLRPRRLAALALAGALGAAAPAGPALASGADGRFERRSSSHFVLDQDVPIDRRSGWNGAIAFERKVLEVLESAYDELDRRLGLRPRRSVQVVVYAPERFDAAFGRLTRFPSAGFHDGAIRVRGAKQVSARLARVLHHELVHAAFAQKLGPAALPSWLNEGLAEWFEARAAGQRHPSATTRALLARAHAEGTLPSLAALSGPTFAGLGPDEARVAYATAYALVDHLGRRRGEGSLERLAEALARGRSPERALDKIYRLDPEELEADFRAELEG